MENGKLIPPGSLVSLVQRGIIYSNLENNWFIKYRKNNKTSIQQFMQRRKKILCSGKNYSDPYEKNFYISTEIPNQNTILFCSWHPRKIQGYYSTRSSLNYLLEHEKHLDTCELFSKNSNFKQKKNGSESIEITSIDFNLNGTLISTTFYNGKFVVWTETGIPLKFFFSIKGAIIESKWCENSRYMALAYLSGEIKICSIWYSQALMVILPHRTLMVSLNWKKPQHLLAFSKEMILSDINLSEKKINFIRGHNTQLNDMVYSSNKELIGSCSDDLILKLWKIDRKFKLMMTLKGHKKEIVAIAFKPSKFEKNLSFNKNFLASGSLDFSLRIWDINNKTCLKFIRIEGPVFSIEWSLVSDTIVLGSCGKTYKINLNCEKINCKEISSDYGIFSLTSHPMIEKFMGFSFKKIFLI